ncbi:hypothetical protein AMV158 [Betaentomopoxvirus amoorei]|uniref:AMV158 n=1 Tax=Amsacta moorei entomopoxvirus TaxID=28321 RepID=Q9EMP1_AMEPV|nr:hypothetical protein AMV158 [Amsacta moorei entomopoxvirus]AAG02864.1 AMV158 [Amsacta moorei entomopoxvirus]
MAILTPYSNDTNSDIITNNINEINLLFILALANNAAVAINIIKTSSLILLTKKSGTLFSKLAKIEISASLDSLLVSTLTFISCVILLSTDTLLLLLLLLFLYIGSVIGFNMALVGT